MLLADLLTSFGGILIDESIVRFRQFKNLITTCFAVGWLVLFADAATQEGEPDASPHCDVAPVQPVIGVRVFDLGAFGAIGDAKYTNTDAFRRAVAEVERAGGGTLVVSAGIYRTGSFDLCSGINLQLN